MTEPKVELGPLHTAATTTPPSTGGAPVDHTTEMPALAALERRGFKEKFIAEGDQLRVSGTDRRYPPEDVQIRDYYRFEGTSDPDDMSVVYALEASDGTRGVLVDAFGQYADPAVGALLDRMRVEGRGVVGRRPSALLLSSILGAAVAGVTLAVLWSRRSRSSAAEDWLPDLPDKI